MMAQPTGPGAQQQQGAAGLRVLMGPRWRPARRLGLVAVDALLLLAAFWLAYEIRFDFQPDIDGLGGDYFLQFMLIAPLLALARLLMLHGLGLYRGYTRYTSIHELVSIATACLTGTVLLSVFNFSTQYITALGPYPLHESGQRLLRVPWGVVAVEAMLAIGLLGGTRLALRLLAERLLESADEEARRVLIVGAGPAGERIARDLLKHQRHRYRPVGFIDPDPSLAGARIHGLRVEGGLDRLEDVARRRRVGMLLVALERPAPALLRQIVERCRNERLEFKIIPDLEAVMRGQIEINRLRPVEIEDLLGRPPVVLDVEASRSCLAGRRVLITGAGGSIGAELCRQALEHRPASLTLLGRGENSIFEIEGRLAARAGELGVALEALVGDVRDAGLVGPLLAGRRPQVVLHAAAHKHVHFMELQPAEAIKNNVTGTRVLAEAARAAGVERFILISTDKAVRPAGVMGASKRVAEMIVSALDREGPTRFIAVRFGNVLGSRGSVIPVFRAQLAAGGPLTVTHPEATRYFMTIPEAVALTIEAGSVGQGGEVFLLDMGEPVKILDLARNLVTLSGLEPETDIAIRFTGLRPGEKLYEELLTAEQLREPTVHEKIFRCRQPELDWAWLSDRVARLEALAAGLDADAIRAELAELIPDYSGPGRRRDP